jgi:hypothetical protein
VLEHPAGSIAWERYGLTPPMRGGWSRALIGDPGWVCEVAQSAYGHRARKLTWLYYVGAEPPPSLRWEQPRGTHMVSYMINHGGDLPRLSKREASKSPLPFRDLLISIAEGARHD